MKSQNNGKILITFVHNVKDLFHKLQEDKDFDEVRDEEPSDEEEGVEADTTMTLQGGVRYFLLNVLKCSTVSVTLNFLRVAYIFACATCICAFTRTGSQFYVNVNCE